MDWLRLLHPDKAPCPIEVTELGIVSEVRLEQSSKVLNPMDVTESGIVNEVRLLQL